ncbi:MAG TPA: Chromate resistance protein ChrB [Bacillota bacterium]|nr:Chromate resistance protein ChrB [Bacillota bacterium]
MEQEWLAINFTLPKEPSRVRVSVWRKLKRSGAVNIGQSIWVLPTGVEHLSIFKEVANEVKGNNGLAFIMKTVFVQDPKDKPIVDYFNNARDEEYKEFLDKCEDFHREIQKEIGKNNFSFAEIEENEHELGKLDNWLEGIANRDFFKASLGEESQKALSTCKDVFEDYCTKVYEINGAI